MSVERFIIVQTSFTAVHYWQDAPKGEFGFLGNPHRHVFDVKVQVPVAHNDREVEFLQLKSDVDKFVDSQEWEKTNTELPYSCEEFALLIGRHIANKYKRSAEVLVGEDKENYAKVVYSYPDNSETQVVTSVTITQPGPDTPPKLPEPEGNWGFARMHFVTLGNPENKNDRNVPFLGIEAEGPHDGAMTLFIPGMCHPDDFTRAAQSILDMHNSPGRVFYYQWKNIWGDSEVINRDPGKLQNIYFGAGGWNTVLRPDTFARILDAKYGWVTVETKSISRMSPVTFWMIQAYRKLHSMRPSEYPTTISIVSLDPLDADNHFDEVNYVKRVSDKSIYWSPVNAPKHHTTIVSKKDDPRFELDMSVSEYCKFYNITTILNIAKNSK